MRVPPTIKVGIFDQVNGCQTGNFQQARNYPWRFYVIHVSVGEIDTNWHKVAWKADTAAEQNFAWYFKRHPAASSYDIGNTSSSWQCFKPDKKVNGVLRWRPSS